jgi:Nucleoside 2-deoxyribosyltransferase
MKVPRLSKSYVRSFILQAKRIYLASPWFNPAQMDRMQRTLNVLREWESKGEYRRVYAPFVELVCPPNATPEQQDAVYASNIVEVCGANIIVAVTDEKDIGTIFETGYGAAIRDSRMRLGMEQTVEFDDFSCQPLVVGVALTLGNRPFNLMLARGMNAVCTDLLQLGELLRGNLPEHNWEIE